MGQSSSSQREHPETQGRDSRRFSQLVQPREPWAGQQYQQERRRDEGLIPRVFPPGRGASTPLGSRRPQGEDSQTTLPFATFRRQVSAQSTPMQDGSAGSDRASPTHDELLYEQEERPLVSMEELRMRDAPITHITASPMPRRPSVISRLGSRFLPRYASTGSSSTDEHDDGSRRVLRRRLSDSSPPRPVQTPENRTHHRFSMFGSLSPTSSTSSQSSPRRRLAPISRPIPIVVDGLLPASGLSMNSLHDPSTGSPRSRSRGLESESNMNSLQRRSRLERVRRSISAPLESLFTNSSNQAPHDRQIQTPPHRPSRAPMAEETDYLLPPLNVPDTSLDLDERSIGAFENQDRGHADAFSPVAETSERAPSWHQRWADRAPTVRREARRVPNLLRGRSSRLIRRDDEAPLSRILQLAAAAIAAQLAGTTDGLADMEAIGDDNLDGSLNTFMETLNNAAGAANSNNETQVTFATLPPLNFWRVFRFVNPNPNPNPENRDAPATGRPAPSSGSPGRNARGGVTGDATDLNDGRTVTLVVVGVRSVPSSSINRETTEGNVTNLDTLLGSPALPTAARLRHNTASGGLLRHANGRSRFTTRRRASMGGVNPFPAQYESQRHQRVNSSSGPTSGATTPNPTSVPVVTSDSPPGPHPPPSTPADPYLSAQVSGATTPNRRPSSASAVQSQLSSHQENLERLHEAEDTRMPTPELFVQEGQPVRQRRRSDSEFARHRDLGAGAARRNGIVEVDRHRDLGAGSARRNGVVESDESPAQGRSWLIYVVGTNLSEDHPAFATPSLFTDNPTYEDMLLLSSLLGPAKPPVASTEDVASSLGVFRLRWRTLEGNLHASAIDALGGSLQIAPNERCLVCLCEYELKEDVRKLNKCSHVFHRECIDTWLTTGRNSCPLCRGAGVDEKEAQTPTSADGIGNAS